MEASYARFRQENTPHDSASVLWQLAGEFRHVFANLLWIKVDRYHHELQEHQKSLEADSELMPMIRIITWLDPHFVEAYGVGGWLLTGYLHRPEEGRAFLEEGIAHNPGRWELYESMGWYYLKVRRDPERALQIFRKALEYPIEGFDRERLSKLCENLKKNRGWIQKNMLKSGKGVE